MIGEIGGVREQLAAEPNGTDVAANVVAAVVKALV